MHRLTNDRRQWGGWALLAGLALAGGSLRYRTGAAIRVGPPDVPPSPPGHSHQPEGPLEALCTTLRTPRDLPDARCDPALGAARLSACPPAAPGGRMNGCRRALARHRFSPLSRETSIPTTRSAPRAWQC